MGLWYQVIDEVSSMRNIAKSVFISVAFGVATLACAAFFASVALAQSSDPSASNATISSPASGFSLFNPGAVLILPAPFNAIPVTTGLTTGVAAAAANGAPASSAGASSSGASATGATAATASATGASASALVTTTSFTTSAALTPPKSGVLGPFQAAPALPGASVLTKAPGSPPASAGGSSASSSSAGGGTTNPNFEASPF